MAVAATYRSDPESQFSKPWAVLVVITAAVVGFAIYSYKMLNPNLSFGMIEFELINFMSQSEYLILILALVALVVLLLLSVLKMVAWGTDD